MRIIKSIFIFLGVVLCVHSETCPPEDELFESSSCWCDEFVGESGLKVQCMNRANQREIKMALNMLSGKNNVDLLLYHADLGTLPSNFFYGIGIKKLEISHCNLVSLTNDTQPGLLGLENSLQELTIVSSFRGKDVPPKLQVGHLKKLKKLDLSFNAIDELGDDWFKNAPPSLESLIVSNNNIKKIGRSVFANLTNLVSLAFQGNQVEYGTIVREMFPKRAASLKVLGLDNNEINHLEVGAFNGMPSLSYLSLRGNRISRLDRFAWSFIWDDLDTIHLEGNPIDCGSTFYWVFQHKIKKSGLFGNCYNKDGTRGETLQDFINNMSVYKFS